MGSLKMTRQHVPRRRTAARSVVTVLVATAALASPTALGVSLSGAPVGATEVAAQTELSVERPRGDPEAYKFFAKVDGEPVHWDPCKRIGWRINLRRAPDGARPQAKKALHRINEATGLRFRFRGRTLARPHEMAKNYPRDTKLVMGWSTPRRSQLRPGQAGVGGPRWDGGTGEIISGFVLLNARVKLSRGFGRGPQQGYIGTEGQLLMHELGHAVGLDHVTDEAQIMYPVLTRKRAIWGAGDKRGLSRVGKRAGCF